LDWTLDLLFSKDLVQLMAVRASNISLAEVEPDIEPFLIDRDRSDAA